MKRRLADYELVAPLNPAAHGTLWTARPPDRLRRDELVALKIFDVLDDTAFERAVRELRILAAIDSIHVLCPIDAGQDGGHLFYAFDIPSGGPLAASCDDLAKTSILDVVAGAARGVHDLHEFGIAHRNVTPSTVWLGDVGMIGDAGLSGGLDTERSTAGPLGAAGFTDPDVLRGGRATRLTDVYSIGTTLRWAMTRTDWLPTDRSEVSLLEHAARTNTVADDVVGLAGDVAELILACVDADPSRRPATAAEVADRCDALSVRRRGPREGL